MSRRFFRYDPSLRKIKIPEEYTDQKSIFSGTEPATIFDVGANIGQTTKKYRKLFPKADIYSFEPFPPVFSMYSRNTKGDHRVHPNQIALSNREGSASFYTNSCHYTNSLLPVQEKYKEIANFEPKSEIQVKTETLDNYCSRNKIERIDILKMDVQGGELMVLEGAQKLLRENKIGLIFTEVTFTELYKDQPVFDNLKDFLGRFGFVVYKKYNIEDPTKAKPAEGDVIFIRSEAGNGRIKAESK